MIWRTLESIDRQVLRPAQVILVDNASTDGTLQVLYRWAAGRDYVTVLAEPRPGACAARNRGLAAVTAPWVMFFDSDDEMLPQHVADYQRAIDRHGEDTDIFGRSVVVEDDAGHRRVFHFTARSPLFSHLFRSVMGTLRVVYRTELVRRVGGWDERLHGWNDYELGVRLLLATQRVRETGGAPTVRKLMHTASITGADLRSHPRRWEQALDVVEDDIRRAVDRGSVPAVALLWVEARRMILAASYAREGDRADAVRLRDEVLGRGRAVRRLRAVYLYNRIFGRLTFPLVKLLF